MKRNRLLGLPQDVFYTNQLYILSLNLPAGGKSFEFRLNLDRIVRVTRRRIHLQAIEEKITNLSLKKLGLKNLYT